ncbi:hypothetical protein PG988_003748 [Apiospora saccharicola]
MDFFSFPGEVRNMIYEELLVDTETTIRISVDPPWRPRKPRFFGNRGEAKRGLRLEPVILRLNKQTKAEGSPILYSQNRFDLRNRHGRPVIIEHRCETMLALFARTIGRENAQCIRHVTIQFPHLSQADGGTLGSIRPRTKLTWLTEPPHIVHLLASEYGNVETVEFHLGQDGQVWGPGVECARETDRVVASIDMELRSMLLSLKNITVNTWEAYDEHGVDRPWKLVTIALRESMAGIGWTLEKVPVHFPHFNYWGYWTQNYNRPPWDEHYSPYGDNSSDEDCDENKQDEDHNEQLQHDEHHYDQLQQDDEYYTQFEQGDECYTRAGRRRLRARRANRWRL